MTSLSKLTPRVALAGPKGGGKTWVLNELSRQLEHKLQGIKLEKKVPMMYTLAFADPIYDCQVSMFDALSRQTMPGRQFNELIKAKNLDDIVNDVLGISPRDFRQKFGTEFARKFNPEIWVNIMRQKIRSLDDTPNSGLIILDLRFPNELELCRTEGFDVVYVNTMGAKEKGDHESESYNATMCHVADTIVKTKASANLLVDTLTELFYDHIKEHYATAGLIVPKGKLN